ncbi:MAG: hypothetical protein AAB375_03455 [Patescibacteria group bacterium]
MKKGEISPFHIAVVDAVVALTRSRINRSGPYYIERPQAHLFVRPIHESLDRSRTKIARVEVTCETWGNAVIVLELCKDNPGGWLAWGDVEIYYGLHMNPALANRTVIRHIVPFGSPMRYRIRSRTR